MEKRWALLEQGAKEISENLANELNIDACLAQVLVQRGITNFEDARYFFRPTLTQLHDPFLMMDMEHLKENLKILMKNIKKSLKQIRYLQEPFIVKLID